jgi:hypothetical protein
LVGLGIGLALAVSGCGGGTVTTTSIATVTTSAPSPTGPGGASDTTPSETPANPNSCDALGINSKQLNEGTCQQGNKEFVVVNKDSTLKLDQLNARLAGITTAETLSGRSFGPKAAKGTFVVVKLDITNTTSTPQTFDSSGDVVGLVLCGDNYSEDFDVENGSATDSFVWRSNEIQPNTTSSGTAVFDIPSDRVDCLDKNGNVILGNFRDDNSIGRFKQIGTFRTYH